jgi:hypothetical protein
MDVLTFHLAAEPSKKDKKGKLNGPKAGVEQQKDTNGRLKV